MPVKLPPDIEDLVLARVGSGDFASPEEVLRSAMAPWIAREQSRLLAMSALRSKIADGDADEVDVSPVALREHLDSVAISLQRHDPDAA
ncbi:MAG: type II toxin-antitoxin system ParD family antitoxin [Bosea sp. (in: a-proteobacteria)]